MKPPDQPETANHLSGSGTNRDFYLQRLPREHYQADAVVHWTMPIAMRGTGWLDDAFHAQFREIMLHAAAREGLFCPTYCLMPDHIHLVWMGMLRESDQKNGMKFLREYLAPKLRPHRFQHQAHDHVLRVEQRKRDAFAKACSTSWIMRGRRNWWSIPRNGSSAARLFPAIRRCIHSRKISGRSFGSCMQRHLLQTQERSRGRHSDL